MKDTDIMEKTERIVLIPAYQPDEKLLTVLEELSERRVTLIVVDDGSGAAYESIFAKARGYAAVLTHLENRGKGEALKTGLHYIRRNFDGRCVIVTADADGQHSADDILMICDEAAQSPDKLILGSRKIEGRVPLRSRLGNTVTRAVFKRRTGVGVYDTQTGLRGFTDRSLPFMLDVPGSRYEYEMNMLMMWVGSRRPVKELWIHTIYIGDNGTSHFDTVRDSYRIYREIFRFPGNSASNTGHFSRERKNALS